ncbi:hypothetical protein HAX54_040980 [Datura stramonium]|uniref:Uncharacterized protein n=1 Tax=Datura stramonium TaxID=4076 RepID=A0ABS8VQ01_DATST|nr:hypothetical protein [Datura stramonium]
MSWSIIDRVPHIEDEVVDYRPRYVSKGLDVMKTKEIKGIYGLVLSIKLFGGVRPGFEEPFNDDDASDNEKARVESDFESDGDNGEDSEMGEAAYTPTDDED